MIQKRKVGVVGAGNVGVAAAYAMFIKGVASEIVLVDANERKAEGEAMDLMHGQALAEHVTVTSGSYEQLQGAQVVVVTAGSSQASPSEKRLEMLGRNAKIFSEILRELDRYVPEAILVIATNPVDVLTYLSQELSQRSRQRVIGTGTLLDTSRFRALLGQYYNVDPRSVHAYILGEHGDSEVPVWSHAYVGVQKIFGSTVLGVPFEPAQLHELFTRARDAAYRIVERKGYTNTAIGLVIARIVTAILNDEKTVLPVSVRLEGEYGIENVCLSLPCVIGIDGVAERLLLDLSEEELTSLRHSADLLRRSYDKLDVVPDGTSHPAVHP